MPRRLRPIRRWISTVRPSGRPFATSRCLRSPVEAGSIPYSAVIQPRPWPASQRGTDSCTDAVQITRVPPQLISAEPVAVRTKPGSIVTGRSSSGARPPARWGVMRWLRALRTAGIEGVGSARVAKRTPAAGGWGTKVVLCAYHNLHHVLNVARRAGRG